MRRIAFCCAVAVLAACAKTEKPPADTASAMAPAPAPPPAPAPLSLAEVAGTWNVRSTPEGDTTVVLAKLVVTSDTTGWTLTLPNRKPQKVRVLAVSGDSVVTSVGPYESVLRKGVQVTTASVYRLQDGKLVGTTVARYKTTGPDSVLRLRAEGTRAP